ncbi:hypothetical protein NKH77_28940 [Streptomyces sp. M19]
MWRADSRFDDVGPFTLDALRRMVAARPEAAAGVDRAAYVAVFTAARTSASGTRLGDFVTLPRWTGPSAGWARWT